MIRDPAAMGKGKKISKLLVANRGEIALRVMRSAREMGIRTVAVFSEADRNAPFVRFADEAVCIGKAAGKDSYLKPDRIIAAAEITEAVVELAASLATDGVSEDELERAREPILTSLRESARTNGYWIGAVLGSVQEFPQRLEWSRSRYSDFGAITTSEIDVLAQAFLGPDKCFQVIILPESVPESVEEEVEATAEVGVE